jgi:hypothetical protein
LLAVSSAPAQAQQGNANAIVVKIPAASMPSTVILSASNANGAPGHSVSVPIVLSLGGTTAPGSFQIDLTFDPTKLTFVSATGLSSTAVSAADVRLATTGASPNGMASGVVGAASFTLASSFGTSPSVVNLVNCMSADPSGNPLSTGCLAATVGLLTCTVTGDASPGVADVQAMIDQALGLAPPAYDMNEDGVVNVIDIERVLTAALGGACIY